MDRECRTCVHETICPLREGLQELLAAYSFQPGPVYFEYDTMGEAVLKTIGPRCQQFAPKKDYGHENK